MQIFAGADQLRATLLLLHRVAELQEAGGHAGGAGAT